MLRLNYSYSDSSGYLTDPYKMLSVVDPVTGEPVVRAHRRRASQGPDGIYLFEHRPDTRRRQSLYGELRQDFSGKVLQLGYRYSTDDWEIDSHTLEARLRLPFGDSSYLEPHLRYYSQTAASFYRYSLADGDRAAGIRQRRRAAGGPRCVDGGREVRAPDFRRQRMERAPRVLPPGQASLPRRR